MKKILTKGMALGLSVLLFTQMALASSVESSLWAERRQKSSPQYAALPSGQILSQLPAVQPKPDVAFPRLPQSFQTLAQAIPLTHASIQDVYQSPRTTVPPVVLLQDVHLNTEAQTNIGAVLQELIDQKQVGVVGVEGSFASFDFAPYRKYANRKLTADIVNDMLQKNLLAAPSVVGITSRLDPPAFWGVDDKDHYNANLEALYSARGQKESARKELDADQMALDRQKETTFSTELRAFDALRSAHHDGQIGLGAYLKKLTAYQVDIDLALAQFVEAYDMESNLDFTRIENERRTVIEKLTKTLNPNEISILITQSAAYRTGQMGFGDYYQALRTLCAKKNISLSQTPHFDRYIRYVLLSDGIKAEPLFDAIEKLEQNIVQELARSSKEKNLIAHSEWLSLAKKLVEFSLTPKEWKKYVTLSEASRFDDSNHGRDVLSNRTKNLSSLKPFEDFYHEADIRSEKMVSNLLANSKSEIQKMKVLVVGGFHSPQVADILRQKKISYAVVSPKLTKVEGNGSAYLSVFQRDKTPLDRLFAGEKLFLYPTSVAVTHPQTAAVVDGVLQTAQTKVPTERTVGNQTYEFRMVPGRQDEALMIQNIAVSKKWSLPRPITMIVPETLALWAAVKLTADPTGATWLLVMGIASLFSLIHKDLWDRSSYEGEKFTILQLLNKLGQRFLGGILLTAPIAFLPSTDGLLTSFGVHLIWNAIYLKGISKYLLPLTATPSRIKKSLQQTNIEDFASLYAFIRETAAVAGLDPEEIIRKIDDVRAGRETFNWITRANGTLLEGLRQKVEALHTFDRMVQETKLRVVEAKEDIRSNPTNDLTNATQWLETQLQQLNTNSTFNTDEIKKLAPLLVRLFSRPLMIFIRNGVLEILEDRGSGHSVDPLAIGQWTQGLVEKENKSKARFIYDAFQVWNEEYRFGPDLSGTKAGDEFRQMAIRKFENEITKPYGIPLIGSSRARPEIILFTIETLNLLPEGMLQSDHVRQALSGGIDLSAPKNPYGRIGYYNFRLKELGIHPTIFSKREFIESFLHEFGHVIQDLHLPNGPLNSWFSQAKYEKIGYALPALGESGAGRKAYIESDVSEMFAETFMHYILHGELMAVGFSGFSKDANFWRGINTYYKVTVFGDLDFLSSERVRSIELYNAIMDLIAPRLSKDQDRNFDGLTQNKTSHLGEARDVIRKLIGMNFQVARLQKYLSKIESVLAQKNTPPEGGETGGIEGVQSSILYLLAQLILARIFKMSPEQIRASKWFWPMMGLGVLSVGLEWWGIKSAGSWLDLGSAGMSALLPFVLIVGLPFLLIHLTLRISNPNFTRGSPNTKSTLSRLAKVSLGDFFVLSIYAAFLTILPSHILYAGFIHAGIDSVRTVREWKGVPLRTGTGAPIQIVINEVRKTITQPDAMPEGSRLAEPSSNRSPRGISKSLLWMWTLIHVLSFEKWDPQVKHGTLKPLKHETTEPRVSKIPKSLQPIFSDEHATLEVLFSKGFIIFAFFLLFLLLFLFDQISPSKGDFSPTSNETPAATALEELPQDLKNFDSSEALSGTDTDGATFLTPPPPGIASEQILGEVTGEIFHPLFNDIQFNFLPSGLLTTPADLEFIPRGEMTGKSTTFTYHVTANGTTVYRPLKHLRGVIQKEGITVSPIDNSARVTGPNIPFEYRKGKIELTYKGRVRISVRTDNYDRNVDFKYTSTPLPENELRDFPQPFAEEIVRTIMEKIPVSSSLHEALKGESSWREKLDAIAGSNEASRDLKIQAVGNVLNRFTTYNGSSAMWFHNGQSLGSTWANQLKQNNDRRIRIVCGNSATMFALVAQRVGVPAGYMAFQNFDVKGTYLVKGDLGHAMAMVERENGKWYLVETTALMPLEAGLPTGGRGRKYADPGTSLESSADTFAPELPIKTDRVAETPSTLKSDDEKSAENELGDEPGLISPTDADVEKPASVITIVLIGLAALIFLPLTITFFKRIKTYLGWDKLKFRINDITMTFFSDGSFMYGISKNVLAVAMGLGSNDENVSRVLSPLQRITATSSNEELQQLNQMLAPYQLQYQRAEKGFRLVSNRLTDADLPTILGLNVSNLEKTWIEKTLSNIRDGSPLLRRWRISQLKKFLETKTNRNLKQLESVYNRILADGEAEIKTDSHAIVSVDRKSMRDLNRFLIEEVLNIYAQGIPPQFHPQGFVHLYITGQERWKKEGGLRLHVRDPKMPKHEQIFHGAHHHAYESSSVVLTGALDDFIHDLIPAPLGQQPGGEKVYRKYLSARRGRVEPMRASDELVIPRIIKSRRATAGTRLDYPLEDYHSQANDPNALTVTLFAHHGWIEDGQPVTLGPIEVPEEIQKGVAKVQIPDKPVKAIRAWDVILKAMDQLAHEYDLDTNLQNRVKTTLEANAAHLHALDSAGGIIKSLRWVILKLIPSLAPIYNTRVAPLLENALVFAGQNILMSNGLDAMAAGLVSWGIFAAIHIVEWLVTRDSGRNAGYAVLIAGFSLAINSIFPFTSILSFNALPTLASSTGFHFLVNQYGRFISSPRKIPEIVGSHWTSAVRQDRTNNPFPEITYSIRIDGGKTVNEVYGELFNKIQQLARKNGIKKALNIQRVIDMENRTISLTEVSKDPQLPLRFYDEEAKIFEKHFPGYIVKGPSVHGPGAAIGQAKNYNARIIYGLSGEETRQDQVKRGELTLQQILDETKRLRDAGRRLETPFAYGFTEFVLEGKVRQPNDTAEWLGKVVTALAKQDNAAAINALSNELALGVDGIAGRQVSPNGAVSLDQMTRWTQDPAFLNAFIATLPQDFKMEGKEAVLIATVLKAAGVDDNVIIALTKLQTKKYHVIAFHENMSQDELAAGLALARLTNQTARVTMNANAQAQFNEMKGKLTFALPQLEMMIDPTNTLFMPSADGLTFDAVAFQKLSKLSLEDVALLHSKGLLINAGGLTPPLSILLNDLVPIVRDTNLGQLDRIIRAILSAA